MHTWSKYFKLHAIASQPVSVQQTLFELFEQCTICSDAHYQEFSFPYIFMSFRILHVIVRM